ncbi:MAG TPA: DUF1579 domain-containing protein [Myxococcales bacterium]|nr:DUF1579 domain-containing protein [Myxococcales bacterium]
MISFRTAAMAVLLAASLRPAQAEEKAKTPPQMSAAEQAMMEKYMKAATPGPEHQKLAKLAGKWSLKVTAWMAPGAPPEKSDGTAEFTSLLGGRYLLQEVKGNMGGQPFEGRGVEGYDNVTKERFATWMDSMSTGLLVARGKCAADAKKCTYKGTMPDAVAGKAVPMTQTVTYTDDDHFNFELHGPGPNGKVFKMIEIAYTRK